MPRLPFQMLVRYVISIAFVPSYYFKSKLVLEIIARIISLCISLQTSQRDKTFFNLANNPLCDKFLVSALAIIPLRENIFSREKGKYPSSKRTSDQRQISWKIIHWTTMPLSTLWIFRYLIAINPTVVVLAAKAIGNDFLLLFSRLNRLAMNFRCCSCGEIYRSVTFRNGCVSNFLAVLMINKWRWSWVAR
jgi:hypothetical protein